MNKKNIFLRLLLSIAWVFSTNASAQYYKLVTSETELIDGHQYLIANPEFSKAISTVEKAAKNLNATPVVINGGIIQNAEDAAIFTLKAYTSSYSFHREDVGYLCATNNTSNELTYKKSSDDYCKATITFGSDNTTAIQFIKPTSNPNLLRYNSEYDLFNCYKSGQEPVSLFHYMSGDLDKEFQNLLFSTTSAEVYLGDNFEEPTLSGAMTNVTYSSSNSSVAEVNPTTGEISILNAGTTVITATAAADETYNTANASYTLTVKLTEDIFDFTKPEDFGFESPITSRDTPVYKTITKGVVSITATHSPSTDTRFFNGKNDGIYLGIYINGGGLTFSVPDGSIIEPIVFHERSIIKDKSQNAKRIRNCILLAISRHDIQSVILIIEFLFYRLTVRISRRNGIVHVRKVCKITLLCRALNIMLRRKEQVKERTQLNSLVQRAFYVLIAVDPNFYARFTVFKRMGCIHSFKCRLCFVNPSVTVTASKERNI